MSFGVPLKMLQKKHYLHRFHEGTLLSKYMAQSPKGGLIQGLYKPRHSDCPICFYPGVTETNHGLKMSALLFADFKWAVNKQAFWEVYRGW